MQPPVNDSDRALLIEVALQMPRGLQVERVRVTESRVTVRTKTRVRDFLSVLPLTVVVSGKAYSYRWLSSDYNTVAWSTDPYDKAGRVFYGR